MGLLKQSVKNTNLREKKGLEKENILTDKIFINYFFMTLKRRIILLESFLINKKIK
jgi:hypothetical protein